MIIDKLFSLFTHSTREGISSFDERETKKRTIPEIKPLDSASTYPKTLEFNFQEYAVDEFHAYFKNGVLYNVSPRDKKVPLCEDRQIAYSARYITSDQLTYDLKDAESISAIHIPKFKEINGIVSPTLYLCYILNMRAKAETRVELAVPLVYKAANLLISSPFAWGKKDFYRLVIQLWKIGAVEQADYLLQELEKYLPIMNDDICDRENEDYYKREKWIQHYKEHFEYQQILYLLKDKSPKSYSAWRRMKKSNSPKFQNILNMAKENNIEIIEEDAQ